MKVAARGGVGERLAAIRHAVTGRQPGGAARQVEHTTRGIRAVSFIY